MSNFDLLHSQALSLGIKLNASETTLEKFEKISTRLQIQSDLVFADQNAIADRLGFLLSGTADFTKHRRSGSAVICTASKNCTPLGVSGLNSPGRYMSEISIKAGSEVLSVELGALRNLFIEEPGFGASFLSLVLAVSTSLLWQTRGLQIPPVSQHSNISPGVAQKSDHDVVSRIGESAFFAPFSQQSVEDIYPYTQLRLYSKGEIISAEGLHSDSIKILFSGRLQVSFSDTRTGEEQRRTRSVARPGVSLSWQNGYSPLPAPYTVVASRDTSMLCISQESMLTLIEKEPLLACTVLNQQIWQVGRYQQTAASLSNIEVDDEASYMEALLQDNSARIPVSSVLHGVPHSLRNRFTVGHALDCVYDVVVNGNEAERSVSGLMIDVLHGVERQHRFFTSLNTVYRRVAGAPAGMDARTLRELSNADFARAFDQVAYAIKGMDNLPSSANNIFIYNHLGTVRTNDLANGHAFSIDSHFISSKILLPTYGDSGQRIVRSSRNTEFWRNGYYAPLDNIFVHNADSDWIDETPEEKERRKAQLFLDAQKTLDSMRPLAIAPEGASDTPDNLTPTSPGPLKPGAFLLAAKLQPEPCIVPIALANFDYPVSHATYSAVIKPPFRISDVISDIDDKAELQEFLTSYREEFRGYVLEARELALQLETSSQHIGDDVVSNVGMVSPVEEEFEIDVRELEGRLAQQPKRNAVALYGSSTFRLWTDAQRDIGLENVVNLGFGGATLAACRTYFKRLVVQHNPTSLVIYVGDNDIGGGEKAEVFADQFRLFMSEVSEQLRFTQCFFISIKPSLFRREFLSEIQKANALIQESIEAMPNWYYINFHSPMLEYDGTPSGVFYDDDPLHVNKVGYGLLAKLIRDALNETSFST